MMSARARMSGEIKNTTITATERNTQHKLSTSTSTNNLSQQAKNLPVGHSTTTKQNIMLGGCINGIRRWFGIIQSDGI